MPSFLSSIFSSRSEEQAKGTTAASPLPEAGVAEVATETSAVKVAVEKAESTTGIEPASSVKESAEVKAKDEMPSVASTTKEKNQGVSVGEGSSGHMDETIPGAAPSSVELGNSGWNILHSSAAVFPYKPSKEEKKGMEQLLYGFSFTYACSWCAYHMRLYLKDHPPEVENKHAISQYICRFHNNVNEHLKKPLYNCDNIEELLRRWHPGYPDRMQDKPSWEVRMADAQKKLPPTASGHGSSALPSEKAGSKDTHVAVSTTAVSKKNPAGEINEIAHPPFERKVDSMVHANEVALSAVLNKGGFTYEDARHHASDTVPQAERTAEQSASLPPKEPHRTVDGPARHFSAPSFSSPSVVADNISRHICTTFVPPEKLKVRETLSSWWSDAIKPSLFSSKKESENESRVRDVFFSRDDEHSTGNHDGGEGEKKEAEMGEGGTVRKVASVFPAEYSLAGFIAACFPPLSPSNISMEEERERESHPVDTPQNAMGEESAPSTNTIPHGMPNFRGHVQTVDHGSRIDDSHPTPVLSALESSPSSASSAPTRHPSSDALLSVGKSAASRSEKSWWKQWWPGRGSESGPSTGAGEGQDEASIPLAPPLAATATTVVSSSSSVPHPSHVVSMAAKKAKQDIVSAEETHANKDEREKKRIEGETGVMAFPSSSSTVASPIPSTLQDLENARSRVLDPKRNDLPVLSLESILNELSALLPTVKRASPEVEEMIQMLTNSAKEDSLKVTEAARKATAHILQMKNDPQFPASIQKTVKDQLEALKATANNLQHSQHAEALEAFLTTIRHEMKNYVLSKDIGFPLMGNEKNANDVPSSPPPLERTLFKGSALGGSFPLPIPNSTSTSEPMNSDTKGTAAAALSHVVKKKETAESTVLKTNGSESQKQKMNMMELMQSANDCDIYCPENELVSANPLPKKQEK